MYTCGGGRQAVGNYKFPSSFLRDHGLAALAHAHGILEEAAPLSVQVAPVAHDEQERATQRSDGRVRIGYLSCSGFQVLHRSSCCFAVSSLELLLCCLISQVVALLSHLSGSCFAIFRVLAFTLSFLSLPHAPALPLFCFPLCVFRHVRGTWPLLT